VKFLGNWLFKYAHQKSTFSLVFLSRVTFFLGNWTKLLKQTRIRKGLSSSSSKPFPVKMGPMEQGSMKILTKFITVNLISTLYWTGAKTWQRKLRRRDRIATILKTNPCPPNTPRRGKSIGEGERWWICYRELHSREPNGTHSRILFKKKVWDINVGNKAC